ncbi:hypothetical protein SV7mr_13850 [Stieleria bergensis]|uniref:Uncharacterized protein n=1 Tax=Stieleria bergensis TaxID=2528025 RepID=A0A517SS18_9BACT|nr:hypothetical protein SV7mr_13850 [Planctomycetes bacterium SV_7m_r]
MLCFEIQSNSSSELQLPIQTETCLANTMAVHSADPK